MKRVFQLADVALPVVVDEGTARVCRQYLLRNPVELGVFDGEVLSQGQNIRRALSQGWNAQINDIQAIKKVFAEHTLFHGFREVAV